MYCIWDSDYHRGSFLGEINKQGCEGKPRTLSTVSLNRTLFVYSLNISFRKFWKGRMQKLSATYYRYSASLSSMAFFDCRLTYYFPFLYSLLSISNSKVMVLGSSLHWLSTKSKGVALRKGRHKHTPDYELQVDIYMHENMQSGRIRAS